MMCRLQLIIFQRDKFNNRSDPEIRIFKQTLHGKFPVSFSFMEKSRSIFEIFGLLVYI
jgi:hypothetical protein